MGGLDSLIKELRKDAEGGKVEAGHEVLRKAKIELTRFETLPPSVEITNGSKKERLAARDVYECAVLLSVGAKDIKALERHLLMLRPFNFEYREEIGDSKARHEMIGLELLTLLVDSRLAEFHSLLELVPIRERENDKYITFVVQLEQYLMEGSYNKVLVARKRTPSKVYTWLLENLEETVREEIASCIEVACTSISVSSAQKLINMSSQKELENYIAMKENWQIQGSEITFKGEEAKDLIEQIPSHQLIKDNLNYAHELERIV